MVKWETMWWSVNYVLTQQAGKLNPATVRMALRKHGAGPHGSPDGDDRGGGPGARFDVMALAGELSSARGSSKQVREMHFAREIKLVEETDKSREFKGSKDFLGGDLLLPQEVHAVKTGRKRAASDAARALRTAQRARVDTSRCGPLEEPSAYARGESVMDDVVPSSSKVQAFEQMVWKKRRRALERLVRIAGTVIVRRRATERLLALRRETSKAAELPAPDLMDSASSKRKAAGGTNAFFGFSCDETDVDSATLPTHEHSDSASHACLVAKPMRSAFKEKTICRRHAACMFAVARYSRARNPSVETHLPIRACMQRSGEMQESGLRGPRSKRTLDAVVASGRFLKLEPPCFRAYSQTGPTRRPVRLVRASPRAHLHQTFVAKLFQSLTTESCLKWPLRQSFQRVLRVVDSQPYSNYDARECNSSNSEASLIHSAHSTSNVWRERRQVAVSSFSHKRAQPAATLWSLEDTTRHLAHTALGTMSDSESDDEASDMIVPTMRNASEAFVEGARVEAERSISNMDKTNHLLNISRESAWTLLRLRERLATRLVTRLQHGHNPKNAELVQLTNVVG